MPWQAATHLATCGIGWASNHILMNNACILTLLHDAAGRRLSAEAISWYWLKRSCVVYGRQQRVDDYAWGITASRHNRSKSKRRWMHRSLDGSKSHRFVMATRNKRSSRWVVNDTLIAWPPQACNQRQPIFFVSLKSRHVHTSHSRPSRQFLI